MCLRWPRAPTTGSASSQESVEFDEIGGVGFGGRYWQLRQMCDSLARLMECKGGCTSGCGWCHSLAHSSTQHPPAERALSWVQPGKTMPRQKRQGQTVVQGHGAGWNHMCYSEPINTPGLTPIDQTAANSQGHQQPRVPAAWPHAQHRAAH